MELHSKRKYKIFWSVSDGLNAQGLKVDAVKGDDGRLKQQLGGGLASLWKKLQCRQPPPILQRMRGASILFATSSLVWSPMILWWFSKI